MFILVFGGGIILCVNVYRLGGQFEQNILWTKERMIQLSTLTMHISILETRWLKIYQMKNDTVLNTAKEEYIKLS